MFSLLIQPSKSFSGDDFAKWLESLRADAIAMGISEKTLDKALTGLEPVKRVVKYDRNQPELKIDYQSYLKRALSTKRIDNGHKMMVEHKELLDRISEHYGVQTSFLVAIWGLETNYGGNTGDFPVIGAVATLAYDKRRSSFFRKELLYSLKIIDEGHIGFDEMKGSWAGAMGQLQFMPSTFISFAVDEDKDGRKDIWHSLPDVFASAANFLSSYGWNGKFGWGGEVQVPPGLNNKYYGLTNEKTLGEWYKLGVRWANGGSTLPEDIKASLIKPEGENSPSFLVYKNYKAILKWNRSHLYALAVSHLADILAGKERAQEEVIPGFFFSN